MVKSAHAAPDAGALDNVYVPGRSIRLPFLQTGPLDDLVWGLRLLPVWWALGIEQMAWALIGVIAITKILSAQQGRIEVPAVVLWSVLFLMTQAASGLFIVEGFRVITLARNFTAYVGATLWMVVLINVVKSMGDARHVLTNVAVAMIMASAIGLAAIVGVWQSGFTSPMGLVLPPSITSTAYGGTIATRTIGAPAWFIGLGSYFRVSSVFMFATFFATALVVTLPIVLWLRHSAPTKAARWGWTGAAMLLAYNLPFTTGRIALGSWIVGGTWFFLFRRRASVALGGLVAASVGVVLVTGGGELTSQVGTAVEAAAYARGSGSVEGRTQVYISTLSGFVDRPILGWGTERDVPGQVYPAGSHSTYLGILYKHGLLGFACLIGVLVSGWRATRPDARFRGTAEFTLLRYGRWVYVTVLLNGLTDVLDLDATTLTLIYTILGILVAVRLRLRKEAQSVARATS